MLCEICKIYLIPIKEKSVQGWICPKCGWEVLTTFIDEINQDITEYRINIKKSDSIDIEKIKAISQIAGINFLSAKEVLMKGNFCILKAKAVEILEAIEKLQKVNIQFEITPDFQYKI